MITLKNAQIILNSKASKHLLLHQTLGDLMKIRHGYDWSEITSPNDLTKVYCDNCKLYDAYHTLIYGEDIFLLEISMSKSWMKQNDENLSELGWKSFQYKSHKKAFVHKWISLYLS